MIQKSHLHPRRLMCGSWDELAGVLESLGGAKPYEWLFRGQRRASWTLMPGIERGVFKPKDEESFLSDFRAKAHLYSTSLPPRGDRVSWLSTMQHFGLPTSLLDWSYSAFIGLYFAVEHPSEEENCAIWAVNARLLVERSRQQARSIYHADLSELLRDDPFIFRTTYSSSFWLRWRDSYCLSCRNST